MKSMSLRADVVAMCCCIEDEVLAAGAEIPRVAGRRTSVWRTSLLTEWTDAAQVWYEPSPWPQLVSCRCDDDDARWLCSSQWHWTVDPIHEMTNFRMTSNMFYGASCHLLQTVNCNNAGVLPNCVWFLCTHETLTVVEIWHIKPWFHHK